MNTPIYDFVKKYADSDVSRLHMPGHKGNGMLGIEGMDITEIKGADSLYEAEGIIRESEKNASYIFGSGATFYSAEGSSLCIRAMLHSALINSGAEKPVIAAVRNVHKSFIYACALLDIDIEWIYPRERSSICSGVADTAAAEKIIASGNPFALYLTSPNYLGEMTDIKEMAKLCEKYGIPLLVDNAHGAYLRFTGEHPINNGAAMCCDSAHKTLPVLTGGAYLHVSDKYERSIRNSMELFGSTSPSYLILSSLDLCNKYLSDGYTEKLNICIKKVNEVKEFIKSRGFSVIGNEPLKITVATDGIVAAEMLRRLGGECEYADKSYIVFMLTPENTLKDFQLIKELFSELLPCVAASVPHIPVCEKAMTVREAIMSKQETVCIKNAVGRICASPTVSCPPAVPITVSGEIISKEAADVFEYYGIDFVSCVK